MPQSGALVSLMVAVMSGRATGTTTTQATTTTSTRADFTVRLLVTGQVRGAAFPVDKYGTQCTYDQLNSTPCECFGGAARRHSFLAPARNQSLVDVVALDMGAYFFGSGLFFPTFRGRASSEFLASAGYSAIGLSYRDIIAGVNSTDGTGGRLLAQYLDSLQAHNPALCQPSCAVATNLNLTDDPHLSSGHVATYKMIQLSKGRRMAFLSLLDPTYLDASPHYLSRIERSFSKAIHIALATMRRSLAGPPDVVVVSINGIDVTSAQLTVAGGSREQARVLAMQAIVEETIGVDIVLFQAEFSSSYIHKNWMGDDVLIVPGGSPKLGGGADDIEAVFDSKGVLKGASSSHSAQSLNCSVDSSLAVLDRLVSYDSIMRNALGAASGYLAERALGDPVQAGNCTKFPSSKTACGCRVADCGAGRVSSDAIRWFSNANVSLVNGGSIRASLVQGQVTLKNVLEMFPFLNNIVVLKIPGSVLRRALGHGISRLNDTDAHQNANGRFLQVSSTLYFEWFFEAGSAKVGVVKVAQPSQIAGGHSINFIPVESDTIYSVAVSDYIARGGDKFTMFKPYYVSADHLSKSMYEAVAEYTKFVAPTSNAPLSVSGPIRIVQKDEVMHLELGVLCRYPEAAAKEACDAALRAIEALNDKTDGFLDDVIVHTKIFPRVKFIGCGDGYSRTEFLKINPRVDAAVGDICSNDAEDLSGKEWRTTNNIQTVFIVSGTSATPLRDGTKYPNLVRLWIPEHHRAVAFASIFLSFGWKLVGILMDDSLWGKDTGTGIRDAFLAASSEHVVLNSDAMEFSMTGFKSGEVKPGELLQRLVNVRARIAVIVSQLWAQRLLFSAMYTSGLMFGKGFAWFSGWMAEDILRDDNGNVAPNAVHGSEGLIGMVPQIATSSPEYKHFVKLWQSSASAAACKEVNSTKYCDSDGLLDTLAIPSAVMVDAVITYARAMDKIYRTDPHSSTKLHEAALNLGTIPGNSGPITLDNDGDRLGSYEILNLKIKHGAVRRLGATRSLAQVPLSSSSAVFQMVGTFNTQSGAVTLNSSVPIWFPGGTTEIPSDRVVVPAPIAEQSFPIAVLLLSIGGVILFFACLFSCYYYRTWKFVRALRQDLDKMKDAMVGVLAVVEDHDPRNFGDDTLAPGDGSQGLSVASTSAGLPAVPSSRPTPVKYRSLWYWAEDAGRLQAHNQAEVFQPGNFVKYAGGVCADVEEAWCQFRDGTGPSNVAMDLTDRIASTGTETKAYAADSGVKFEINFGSMQQVNLKTGFGRAILRREVEVPSTSRPSLRSDASLGTTPLCTGTMDKNSTTSTNSRSVAASKKQPADLKDEDFLMLHQGQLLQYSQRRADGWGFGVVIFDEIASRPAIDQVGLSNTSGWFPISCTELPNTSQLQKLQAIMGGEGAASALKPPDYWASVKDPLEAQLFRLKDGPEKQRAVDAFKATLPPTIKVVSVDRIQNMSLWQSYAVKRQTVAMHAACAAKEVERAWLFHGTTEDIVPKVIQQGFNRSFCGRNATMYGKGVYFARDASYSSSKTYSAPDAKGLQRMFLCRVAVGDFCQGKKDGLAPDVKSGHILYDTTVDNMRDPSIFVTYHDGQGYPEYLIHFQQ